MVVAVATRMAERPIIEEQHQAARVLSMSTRSATRTGRSEKTVSSSDTDTIWCTPTRAPMEVPPIMMAMTADGGQVEAADPVR